MKRSYQYINGVINLWVLICLMTNSSFGQNEKNRYDHPIPYNPMRYICHKISNPLNIDGRADESEWQLAAWSNEFVDIEGILKPVPDLATKMKMLWDDNHLYVYAIMEEPHIWANLTNRDDIIYYDDDFEIFIDPDGDGHNYYELEWNAYNTLWDLILLRPYRTDGDPKVLFEWNVDDIESAVHVEGTINDNRDIDQYWSIEIAIPFRALRELAFKDKMPNDGDQWRINFSRVDWQMEHDSIGYRKKEGKNGEKIPEQNWVWSPTGRINMHMPETWGYLQFSNSKKTAQFIVDQDEKVKWALWNLYWQQRAYFEKYNRYTSDLALMTIPVVSGCDFTPEIYITPHYYEIVSQSCDHQSYWILNKNGKIYKRKITK